MGCSTKGAGAFALRCMAGAFALRCMAVAGAVTLAATPCYGAQASVRASAGAWSPTLRTCSSSSLVPERPAPDTAW